METAGILLAVGLVFAGIVLVPSGSDPQAFGYKLTEAIRILGFREMEPGPHRVFRGPAWMRWVTGLQVISVEPAGSGAVLVTGPGFWVSFIGRRFTGVTVRPYVGRQPVWPLVKGPMRVGGIGMGLLLAVGSHSCEQLPP